MKFVTTILLFVFLFEGAASASPLVTSPYDWERADAELQFAVPGSTGGALGLSLSPGWTFLQDTQVNCSLGTSCTTPSCINASYCLLPTTTGSVWIAALITENTLAQNVSISSVTGGGGSWASCSTLVSTTCHVTSAGNNNLDAWVNTTGTAATGAITVNLSAIAVSEFFVEFIELLPPTGFTGSLHAVATTSSPSCHVCTVAAVTAGGTDAIVQLTDVTQPFTDFNAWSGSYITDYNSEGIGLNVTSGAAPTFTQATTPGGSTGLANAFITLDFTSTAGSFTAPTPLFSLVNYTQPENGTGASCSPTCTLTLPSTGSAHLGFLQEMDLTATNPHILSIAGSCGTFVVPTACRGLASGNVNSSCAYVLSSTAACTSLPVTMSANSTNTVFAWYEISRTSGSFAVDAGPTCQTIGTGTTSTGFFPGQALTLNGSTPDVIFQSSIAIGGISSATLYPWNYNQPGLGVGKLIGSGAQFYAALLMLMNTQNGAALEYAYPEEPTQTAGVCGFAFK